MPVEDLDHPGEVRKRSRQSIDLIDHYNVDQTIFDVRQQLFERGALHCRSGKTAVIVRGLAQSPAYPLLTADVSFARLALRMQRIEVLLKFVGARVHLNPLVVTLALMFWGMLWGGIGLVLAIPLTAAIKAVCDNVGNLQAYGKLLGD